MSETTHESTPAAEMSDAPEPPAAVSETTAEPSAPSAPAPPPTPTQALPPEPVQAPAAQSAQEADEDDWSNPERGREAKRKANQEAKKLKSEIEALRQQLEQRVDPEESKAAIALVEAESARQVARLKCGHQYGLPDDVTELLHGDTAEEIEAHAMKLAAHFGATAGLGRGGLDPTDEPTETDPKKLAAQIPRFH